jgi:hypothetical protein
MQSLAKMLSRASSAEEDFAYLTKTMPLAAIRSILQYSRSLNFAISAYRYRDLTLRAALNVFSAAGHRQQSRTCVCRQNTYLTHRGP